ncbi:MAG: hypothetical protein QOC88_532 [Mycobacterium sp.]|nr:hypothetical protein [Mycobacterium sp.]
MQFARIVHSAIPHHRHHTGSDPRRGDSEIPDPIVFATGHDTQVNGPAVTSSAINLAP